MGDVATVPPVGGLMVTVDELRALRRLDEGLRLPRFVTVDDESGPTTATLDATALRGLAARDLLDTGRPGAVRPHPTLAALLAPYRHPTLFVEIEAEVDGRLSNTALAGTGGPSSGTLQEPPDIHISGLLALESTAGTDHDAILRLCHVDAVAQQPHGDPLTVDAAAHAEADELALEGDVPAAVAQLVAGGATTTAATAWVDAVLRRRAAVAVTVAHLTGDTTHATDLRWLVAADGTAWQVTAGERSSDTGTGTTAADAVPVSIITPVGAPAIRAALADLVRAPAPAEVGN